MKKNLFIYCLIGFFAFSLYSCEDYTEQIEDLQSQIDEINITLETNNKITDLEVLGDSLIITFGDGSTISTALTASPIPYIGTNGNWWVNSTDLGVKADGDLPIVGENGNWWIDGEDTGIAASATVGNVHGINYDNTTGILTITLDSGEGFNFLLYLLDQKIQGSKIEDLNGEYLLSGINNGDFPFIGFEYDDNNRLSTATYYSIVFNEPVKYLTVERTYNTSGDILTQTYTEWATTEKAIQEGDELTYKVEGIEMTIADAVLEVFGDITDSSNPLFGADETDFINAFGSGGSIMHDNGYVYNFFYDGDYHVSKHLVSEARPGRFGISDESGDVYIWTPESTNEEEDNWLLENQHNIILPTTYAYDPISIKYDGSNILPGLSNEIEYYPWAQIAKTYTGEVDVVSEGTVYDFVSTAEEDFENPQSVTGNYKTLLREYNTYSAGEATDVNEITYTYTGSDFAIQSPDIEGGEDEDLMIATITNDRITKLSVYDSEADVPGYEDKLSFNYDADGKLTGVVSIEDSSEELVLIGYDNQGNPTGISVNPELLKPTQDDIDNGEGIDEEALEFLGLVYSADVYDADLGMKVEKYYYPTQETSLIEMSYNYEMKNFMNHTFTAINPLMSFFGAAHAINGIGWAGHGSALFTEYEVFNEGGYPTEIKTYITVSASDVLLDDADMDVAEEFGIPINGSVAVTYKLEYIKKK